MGANGTRLAQCHRWWCISRTQHDLPREGLTLAGVPDRLGGDAVTAPIDDFLEYVHFFPLARVGQTTQLFALEDRPPRTLPRGQRPPACESRARDLNLTTTFPDSTGPTDRVTMTYDAVGRLSTRTDQAGSVTTYSYDAANRAVQKTDPDGKIETYTVDAVGRLTTGTSGRYGTTVTRIFDTAGRLATEELSIPVTESSFVVSYDYDAADRLNVLTYPDGSQVFRTYNNRDLPTQVFLGNQSIAQLGYDDGGRLAVSTLGNGLTETRTYRNDGTAATISTNAVGDYTYSYDGRKRKLTEAGAAVNGTQRVS